MPPAACAGVPCRGETPALVPTAHEAALPRARWALLFGNFAIGCGVMVVSGALNDLSRSLGVSVALAGQLIAIAAAVMCFGAPLLAGLMSGWDRRRLLSLTLLWYAIGHGACALMPDYASLWPVRALTMLSAAIFTPQAAAVVGFIAPPAERSRSVTFVFLGWSIASVAGMPLAAWVGETLGWRVAMWGVALLALIGAAWVYRALPDRVRPPSLSLSAWGSVFANPVLMAIVAVTALQSAGQFTLWAYMTPYLRQVLHASPATIGLVFTWFGVCGLAGTVLLSRQIDRIGPGRAVALLLGGIGIGMLLWPLATTPLLAALLLTPWTLSAMACNSAQQARLVHAAPLLASALMALNTSAIYLGQAAGAASGGWIIVHDGYGSLHWIGFGWVAVALATSIWASRRAAAIPSLLK